MKLSSCLPFLTHCALVGPSLKTMFCWESLTRFEVKKKSPNSYFLRLNMDLHF